MRITPLGAGQDVGKSCILVTIGARNVMLDCGMHMGFSDERKFPDFGFISTKGPLDAIIDLVLISHFHLDHCGALPHMTEIVGYSGPIVASLPTKAICPILLKDFARIIRMNSEESCFSDEDVDNCMSKVSTINRVNETIEVADGLWVKAFYAGHVIGACMFLLTSSAGESVLYTGDFNMTADRHLGSARVQRCFPQILITESTYATTVRGSRYSREQDFLAKVQSCIVRKGKVLIPCFALGRAQELCILLDSHWTRQNIKVPIYFSTGLTEKAVNFYKMFTSWTSTNVLARSSSQGSIFDFRHIRTYKPRDFVSIADTPGAAVIFATPGMLHAGTSLRLFRKLAPDPANMIILPGYCVRGTVGDRIIRGERVLKIEGETVMVNLSVEYLSFSAHADAKGIIELIEIVRPDNVVLVHGEKQRMAQFINHIGPMHISPEVAKRIINYYFPANGETIDVPCRRNVVCAVRNPGNVEGVFVANGNNQYFEVVPIDEIPLGDATAIDFQSKVETDWPCCSLEQIGQHLESIENIIVSDRIQIFGTSVCLKIDSPNSVLISWSIEDDEMAEHVESLLRSKPQTLASL